MEAFKLDVRYRWPALLAVLFHALIGFFLIASIVFYHPSDSSLEQSSVQATLVSSSQLAAMMAKPVAKPSVAKPSPLPAVKATPMKAVEQKTAPTEVAIPKPQPKVSKPQATKKTPPQKTQQKSLEDMLQAEVDASHPSLVKTLNAKQQALLTQQLAAEEGASSSKGNSREHSAEVDKYKALILRQIQQNWIMPKNVEHLSCLLEVSVAPGGTVLGVKVLKSSGNEVLDNSAIAAVNKSSPLPVPKDSSSFSAFRRFTLTVKPEGTEFSAL